MSFYVLDFCNHEFTTCENQDDVVNKIHELRKRNVSDDLITVINRDIDSVEMDLPAYWELEKSLHPNSDDDPDKCPVCGATLEGHGDEEDGYGNLHCYWSCHRCGSTGVAEYDETDGNKFIGHTVD